jgi:sphinganine-1-phosphate aldolase
LTVPIINELITDLVECTEELAANKSSNKKNDTAAIYGVAGSVSTSGVANRLVVAFLDALYKV